jgi:hypothetical protein
LLHHLHHWDRHRSELHCAAGPSVLQVSVGNGDFV